MLNGLCRAFNFNLFKILYWWLGFRLELISSSAPAASDNAACLLKKWSKHSAL